MLSTRVRLFYSDADRLTLPAGHRFPASKYVSVWQTLAGDHPRLCHRAERASFADIATVHEPGYLARVQSGTLEDKEVRRLGFPWSEGLVARSLRSVGGTLAALEWALAHGAAGHMAGGTHHAFQGHGAGYCVFNDIAIATRRAREEHGLKRVAIVDLDVHQGDGTAAIFQGDPAVFTLSLHGAKNYPFRKETSTYDGPLPDGCDDATYLRALDEALFHVEAFRPELVFYQAGVDALEGDRLGRLALTVQGMTARDRRVYALVKRLGVPLVVTLGGGYGRDLEKTICAHVNVYRALVELL